MAATWFTADTHFGHRSIIDACQRPWPDVATMDEALIGLWNATVREHDVVWHLGDFALRTGAARIAGIFGIR